MYSNFSRAVKLCQAFRQSMQSRLKWVRRAHGALLGHCPCLEALGEAQKLPGTHVKNTVPLLCLPPSPTRNNLDSQAGGRQLLAEEAGSDLGPGMQMSMRPIPSC